MGFFAAGRGTSTVTSTITGRQFLYGRDTQL
jgi:hypothetical protein